MGTNVKKRKQQRNRNQMYKRFSLLIVLCFIICIIDVSAASYQGGNQLVSEENWEQYKEAELLMSNLPYYILDNYGNQHYFNRELWENRSLIVYGDYSSIYPNDFKAATQNATGIAYYNGGEYRYHGYSQNGSKLNNLEFPDDAVGNNNLLTRNWIFQPWQTTSFAQPVFKNFVGISPSIYNSTAINNSNTLEGSLVAKWINQSVDFIRKGTQNGRDSTSNLDPLHYINIDSVPSAYSSGQGTMLHLANNNKIYYQSFPIDRYQKEATEITASIAEIATVAISEAGNISLEILVNAQINDEAYINNGILESIYYTRKDISEWNFTLKNSLTSIDLFAKGFARDKNKTAYYLFQLELPRASYQDMLDSNNSINLHFLLEAEAVYATNDTGRADATANKIITGAIDSELLIEANKGVSFNVRAPSQILDVDRFALTLWENDISAAVEKYVEINGRRLDANEQQLFLTGNYQFPKIREDRIYNYSINYLNALGERFYYKSAVIVYDSVPHAQIRLAGDFKENRSIRVTADETISSSYLQSRTPITISKFKITSSSGEPLYYGINNNRLKEFLSKSSDEIIIEIVVESQYGAREYQINLFISPDYPPDIIAYVWKNLLARGEGLDLICEANSLDGDSIAELNYEIYYQSAVGILELVASGPYDDTFNYTPEQLGSYKIVFTATEEFGEATIDDHISASDYQQTLIEREFFVDNLVPVTKLFTDIEGTLPTVELTILLDEELDGETRNFLKDSRIELINSFRRKGVNALIEFWDLKTYVSEQTAYKSLATGTAYPPASYYYLENGYSGTLTRTTVHNYPYTVDEGSYHSFTDSFTVTSAGDGYSYSVYYKGVWQSGHNTDTPTLLYYDADGYSGYLYKDSAWQSGKDTVVVGDYMYVTIYYTAFYSGVVTRNWQEWVPRYVTVNDYYGNYAGLVTNEIKQNFILDLIDESGKYLIYFTDEQVNNVLDYEKICEQLPAAPSILVGGPQSASQLATDYFIENNADNTAIIDQLIKIVSDRQKIEPGITILLNEKFELKYSDIDYEGDPIVKRGLQYVHDINFLDNSLGLEQGAEKEYSVTSFTDQVKNSFAKPGLYTVYRRVKDEPIGHAEYGGYSNIANLEIIAHRKPIAELQAITKYDYDRQIYKLSWMDLSYDPDFQFSKENKGIINSNFKYKDVNGDWVYGKPRELAPGEYQIKYVVMDCYGVWSEPFQHTLQLPASPPRPKVGIQGYVKHTDKWNLNRQQFNQARGGTDNYPLSERHFFAGEELILEAVTEGDPERVFVEIIGTGLSTNLQNKGNNTWEGTLWSKEMMNWSGRLFTVRFYAIKEAEPTVHHDVVIEIVKEQFWQQHRLY